MKENGGKLAICPDHPRRRTEVKVCMPGGLRCVVLYFKFYQNRFSGFSAVGGRKSTFPNTLAIGLYNSLYYRTNRDIIQHIRTYTLQSTYKMSEEKVLVLLNEVLSEVKSGLIRWTSTRQLRQALN